MIRSESRDARFARFVRQHRARAVRTAWRLTGEDLATAEEVTQEALLRAHSALARFRDDASLSTWFYRILVRQAANHRRWRGVRQRWAALWGEGSEAGRRDVLGDPPLRDQIAAAMNQLSPAQREAFTLVRLEGFTIVETAHIMGKAPGTIKSHLHRAHESLRHELAPLRQQESP